MEQSSTGDKDACPYVTGTIIPVVGSLVPVMPKLY